MPTYLGALFFGLPVWIFLFWKRKDLHHKMILMSFAVALISPVDTFFIPTYWHPTTYGNLFHLPIDIFTILFGFTLGGIASVIYEELFGKRMRKGHVVSHSSMFVIVAGCLSVFILGKFTQLNFMYEVLIGIGIMVSIIALNRKDLLTDIFLSGFFFALVYTVLLSIYIFIFPAVLSAWNLTDFPQHIIVNVPHFEIIWAFFTGAFLGPFYEYSHNLLVTK